MNVIRGATSLIKDQKEEIIDKSIELFFKIKEKNDIKNIYSILISVTPDIKKYNPATAIRNYFNLNKTAFMCFQEAIFEKSPQKIIRIIIFCESKNSDYVYLHEAKNLRSDLNEK